MNAPAIWRKGKPPHNQMQLTSGAAQAMDAARS